MKTEIPDWLDKEIWKEFKNHRNKIRSSMTPYAERKIIMRLERAKNDGFDPNILLDESIEKGWKTIYPKHNHISKIHDTNAPPPMYRGSVLNPDYQIWLANKQFMEINNDNGTDITSRERISSEALRSIQRSKLDDQDSSMAGKVEESKPRLIN